MADFTLQQSGAELQNLINKIVPTEEKVAQLSREIGEVDASVEKQGREVKKLQYATITNEKGLFITDEDGNIGWAIQPIITEDGGVAFVDKAGNIGIMMKDGKIDICKPGENLKSNWVNDDVKLASVTNEMYAQLKQMKDQLQDIISSSQTIKENDSEIISTIEIPALSHDADNHVVRLGLHFGSQIGGKEATEFNSTPYNDVFFDGKCRKDFGDVRVLDEHDNILDARLEHHGNYECVRDTNYNSGTKIHVNSLGYAVQGRDGGRLYITKNDGVTWERIANQSSASFTCFIDSRDNLFYYITPKLYCIPFVNDGYDFANSIEVLDMSENNGVTNQDATVGAMIEDAEGYLYVGQYQTNWNPIIFKSKTAFTPSADAFNIVYKQTLTYIDGEIDYEKVDQHVHMLVIDKYSGNIYAGLDNSVKIYGPRLIKSTDKGATWVDVNLDTTVWNYQRGRDYLASYFGEDYYIGGGEVNILGGYSLAKVHADVINGVRTEKDIKGVLNTAQGIRRIIDVGGEDFIVAGLVSADINTPSILSLSTDKGETWKSIYSEDNGANESIGAGVRFFTPLVQLEGSSEPCVYVTGYNEGEHKYSAIRLYRGGNHYYGEMFVNVGKMKAGVPKTIKVANKYLMTSPLVMFYNRDVVKPIYSVYFNLGVGNKVVDSNGNYHTIHGEYKWDNYKNDMRFGVRTPFVQNGHETNGLLLGESSYINLGKIPQLTFNKNFSIVVWLKQYQYWQSPTIEDGYANFKVILKNKELSIFRNRIGYGAGNIPNNITRGGVGVKNFRMYLPICITIGNESVPSIYALTGDEAPMIQNYITASSWNYENLSLNDLIIGTNAANENEGTIPFYINRISFYDHVLSHEEMMSINKGYNF